MNKRTEYLLLISTSLEVSLVGGLHLAVNYEMYVVYV